MKEIDEIMEMARDYFDDKYKLLEFLEILKNKIVDKPKIVASWIDVEIFSVRENLIEDRICPECGGELEMEADESGSVTYVPYGDTYVPESRDCILVCSKCNEKYDAD